MVYLHTIFHNDSLNNIWVGINNNTSLLSNVNLNNTGFLLNNTTNEYTVKNIVNWVDNNKFIYNYNYCIDCNISIIYYCMDIKN